MISAYTWIAVARYVCLAVFTGMMGIFMNILEYAGIIGNGSQQSQGM